MSKPTQSAGESQAYKYWAFISYSHQDNLATRGDGGGDHIRWADWLHEHLETFRIPDGYRDRTTRSCSSASLGSPSVGIHFQITPGARRLLARHGRIRH